MRSIVRSFASLALACGLVTACGAGASSTPAPTPVRTAVATAATPAPTPAPTAMAVPTASPTATPVEVVNQDGWSFFSSTKGTFTVESMGTDDGKGNVTGVVLSFTAGGGDPRGAGNGTLKLSFRGSSAAEVIGVEWGTMSVDNASGAWNGTCAGASWSAGDASDLTCWLTGSGAYKGLTHYLHTRTSGSSTDSLSLIYPGSPPSP